MRIIRFATNPWVAVAALTASLILTAVKAVEANNSARAWEARAAEISADYADEANKAAEAEFDLRRIKALAEEIRRLSE